MSRPRRHNWRILILILIPGWTEPDFLFPSKRHWERMLGNGSWRGDQKIFMICGWEPVTGSDSLRKDPVREGGSKGNCGNRTDNRGEGWGRERGESRLKRMRRWVYFLDSCGCLPAFCRACTARACMVRTSLIFVAAHIAPALQTPHNITDCSRTPTLLLKYHQHQHDLVRDLRGCIEGCVRMCEGLHTHIFSIHPMSLY